MWCPQFFKEKETKKKKKPKKSHIYNKLTNQGKSFLGIFG